MSTTVESPVADCLATGSDSSRANEGVNDGVSENTPRAVTPANNGKPMRLGRKAPQNNRKRNGCAPDAGANAGAKRDAANPNANVSKPEVSASGSADKGADQIIPSPNKKRWHILWIAVDHIAPNPFQPRIHFDPEQMEELIQSVKASDVQQPILVRTYKDRSFKSTSANGNAPHGRANGKAANGNASTPYEYELVAGERRLRASRAAKKRWIPAILRDDLSDAQAAELALFENVQRSNLTCIEEARGYKRLMVEFRMKEERIAKRAGKSVAAIRELLKLLQLPERVQELLWDKKLTAAHGYALLSLAPFESICIAVAERIAEDKLTAVSLEQNLLPNHKELTKKGLILELDYKTKFKWQEVCGQCPFKAYVRTDYRSFCLKPDEWEKKQTAAIEQEQQRGQQEQDEAAQVLEQARQDNSPVVDVSRLPFGAYRNLCGEELPAGCTPQCPCRKEMLDQADPTKTVPICLDPQRFYNLRQEERLAELKRREQVYLALWNEAKDKLEDEIAGEDLTKALCLVAYPCFQFATYGYVADESILELMNTIGKELGVLLPWEELLEASEAEFYETISHDLKSETCTARSFLLFCACLLLAHDARKGVFREWHTSALNFVTGNVPAIQEELPEGEEPEDELSEEELLEAQFAVDSMPEYESVSDEAGASDTVSTDESNANQSHEDQSRKDQLREGDITIDTLDSGEPHLNESIHQSNDLEANERQLAEV